MTDEETVHLPQGDGYIGPRPRRLFLVESRFMEGMQAEYYLVWKRGSELLACHAGYERTVRPSVDPVPAGNSSPPTAESVVRDLRASIHWRSSNLRAWDVSEHAGYYHARMCRPEIYRRQLDVQRTPPIVTAKLHAEITSSVAAAQLLFDDLDDVLATIEPVKAQERAYGHRTRMLLLLACMEVESALSSVLKANDRSAPDRPTMMDYARLAVPMRLWQWKVRLVRSTEQLEFTPFEVWTPTSAPQLPWYQAYNATKHGREAHLNQARLDHLLNAVAGVFVLLIAQFGFDVSQRLRHRPFEVVRPPDWSPEECYVLSPFEPAEWRRRPYFPGRRRRAQRASRGRGRS